MLKGRVVAAVTSVMLAAGALVAAPGVAHADDYCDWDDSSFPTIESYSPSTVVLGTQSKLVTFRVNADDDCGIAGWEVENDNVFAYDSNPTEKIYPWSNSDAGRGYMDVSVHDSSYNTTTERFAFTLKRATYVSGFDVTPEPVKKGKYVTVKGTLKRADWDQGKYTAYGANSQKVQIQFRAKSSSSYKTIKTVTLGKGSAIKTKLKVSGTLAKDGYYRLSYAGNGSSGPSVAAGDYVDVK